MRLIKKLVTNGTSLAVNIDKVVVDSLKLKKGDLVEIDIKKAK